MFWTHIYDLILKLLTLFLIIIGLIQIPLLEGHGIITIILAIILYFIIYNLLVRTLATLLYCRTVLKMKIGLAQARNLNEAFSPVSPINTKWLPMTELKGMEGGCQYTRALEIHKNWLESNMQIRISRKREFQGQSFKTKILTIILWVVAGYFTIAGLMNLPPATYVGQAFMKIFGTDYYYPVLNTCILVLPTILIFRMIDKDIRP